VCLTAAKPSHPAGTVQRPSGALLAAAPRPGGDSGVVSRVAVGGDDARMRLDGVEVRAGEWRELCATTIEAAGSWVVAISTVVRSRSVVLASCYLADFGQSEVAVSHLWMLPGPRSEIVQRPLAQMPGQTHARACLLDHAAELRDVLEELEQEQLAVDVAERALEQAARAWEQRSG
jgi:hypothetical protein